MEALVSSQSNPNTLQFLMEQMKQNAAGLTQMQFNIGKSHQTTLDERDIAMNTRDAQLKGRRSVGDVIVPEEFTLPCLYSLFVVVFQPCRSVS